MCELSMESAFNADLARQLAANCGAAMDKVSRKHKDVTLKVRWDPNAMKAVVEAWYHVVNDPVLVTESLSIGTSAIDVELQILGLSMRAVRAWKRNQPVPKAVAGYAPSRSTNVKPDDDDNPF